MQSTLLSPAESHAFQNFLSSIDYPDAESVTISAAEWALYNNNAAMYSAQDDPFLGSEPNIQHREALAKATKDLMSLDSDSWGAGASTMDHHPGVQQHHQVYNANGHINSQYDQQNEQRMLVHQQQVMQHQQQHRLQQEQQRHNSFSTTHDLFPFLHSKVQQQQPHPLQLQYPSHSMPQQHLAVSPLSSDHSSPNSPHSPYNFQQQHNSIPMPMHHAPQQQQQVQIPQQQTPAPASRAKRMPNAVTSSSRSTLQSSSSSPNPNAAASSSSSHSTVNGARQSTNGVNGASKRQRSSTSPTTISQPQSREGQPSAPPKQTLLSPSQKKANHIQSEQKRRANIRRGYEALCETVPALREAIREEEETERNGGMLNGSQRKKGRGKKNGKEGGDEREKDRLDGRAGPRSENVVLSKTIDHIEALLADRSSLLARLHRARSSLPPGHPALTSLVPDPPWEREWKGGEGKLGEEDPDGDGVSDGEDGEEE